MTTFDRQFARLLLEICRYTYAKSFKSAEDKNDAKDALDWINQAAKPSLDPIMLNDDDKLPTSVACVVVYPDKNIVAYMGTKTQFNRPIDAMESAKDWFENVKAVPVPFKLNAAQLGLGQDMELGGKVHKGFLEELGAVQAKVVQVLLQHGGKERPLYVTGHSQGGAEATLATRAFLAGGFTVAAAYTFAAPRSGDQQFAGAIPATLPFHRLEFGDDIVPHVPPTLISTTARKIVDDIKAIEQKKLDESGIFGKFFGLVKSWLPGRSGLTPIEFLDKITTNSGFVGVGRLCYGSHESNKLRVDLSAEQEADIFGDRLKHLIFHPKNWAEHHHLAGTKEDIEAGRKGNYTALVSDFPLAGN